jgi:hypothetical protein
MHPKNNNPRSLFGYFTVLPGEKFKSIIRSTLAIISILLSYDNYALSTIAEGFVDNYDDRPLIGTPMTEGNCATGILRGVSFDDYCPRYQGPSNRIQPTASRGAWVFGIRLAHDM